MGQKPSSQAVAKPLEVGSATEFSGSGLAGSELGLPAFGVFGGAQGEVFELAGELA